MANEKTKKDLEIELKILKAQRFSESLAYILNNAFKWISLTSIPFFTYLSIKELAGNTTFANIAVNFLANWSVSITFSVATGVAGVVYGARQRKLRKDSVERLQDRIKYLEEFIDKNRSSSNLTPQGNTRPEDKL